MTASPVWAGFHVSRRLGKAFAKGMPEFKKRRLSPPFSTGGEVKKLASLMFATGLLALVAACATSDSTTSPDIATEDPTGAWALQSFQLDDGRESTDRGWGDFHARILADCGADAGVAC